MSLLATPDEILVDILFFLIPSLRDHGDRLSCRFQSVAERPSDDESERQLALSYTSRTCKRLRRIALPVLYHTIPATSTKLLQTLATDAYLASLVKGIDVMPGRIAAPVLRGAFRTAVLRHGLTLPPKLENRIIREVFDNPRARQSLNGARVPLYLALLPNIETFACPCERPRSDAILNKLFCRADCMPPRLREIRLRYLGISGTIHIFRTHDLLLPTIQKLHGIALSWELGTPGSVERGTKLSRPSLKQAELLAANINHLGLDDLLSRSPELRILRVVWAGARRMPEYPLWFKAMGNALRRHGYGLEELALDPTAHVEYRHRRTGGPIGSLQELTRLTTLAVPYDLLIGEEEPLEHHRSMRPRLTEVLPESLENLHILMCRDDEDLEQQIWDLMRERERFANLQQIRIRRQTKFGLDVTQLGFNLIHDQGEIVLTK